MAIIKTMITTVIILQSVMIKIIISDNNDNETYIHERFLDFSNHFATFFEI